MKGCIPQANLEVPSDKKHCLPICLFWPVGLDIFKNEETLEKRCVEIEDSTTLYTFVLGFQEKSIYIHFTLMF